MGTPETFEIRLLTEADIPAAMRLKELARWNQTEADWRRLLRLEPRGCFAATAGGRVVATTTTTRFGRELAWVGMVLVEPDYRRRGIATRLLRAALDYLRGAGVPVVKLDATPAGRPVYEALGFEAESLVERWAGEARRERRDATVIESDNTPAVEMGAASRPELFALDRRAFGADRSALLDSLIAEACVAPLVCVAPGGGLKGYVLARRGTAAAYVGPLVATDSAAATALLDAVLGRLAGRRVYVDLNTRFESGAHALTARGLARQRELIRMSYGGRSRAVTSAAVFAIAGPEVG
jgi:predicted N-acetyltransferase YhbS